MLRQFLWLVGFLIASLANANEPNIQFKTMNEGEGQAKVTTLEEGVDFHEVISDGVRMETIEMGESEGMHSYVSPEVKRKKQFKFYNNTYMYVSFREKFVAKPGEKPTETKLAPRDLYRKHVFEYLKNAQDNEGKLQGVDLGKLTLKQAAETHVSFTVADQKDFQKIANNLKQQKEVLAVEWLDRKKTFGDKASIDEMSSFKSRVKKQKVEYDPDKSIDYEEIKRKQQQKEFDKKMEEERKKGNVRTPTPYQGKSKEAPHDEL